MLAACPLRSETFCCEGSLLKSVRDGIGEIVGWHDIRVTHDALGKPQIETSDALRRVLAMRQIVHSHISITDETVQAMAFVVIEKS